MECTGKVLHFTKRILLPLVLVMMSNTVTAGVYKWTDENGQVHYSERPPEESGQVERVAIDPAPKSSDEGKERLNQYKNDLDTMMKEKDKEKAQQDAEKNQNEIKKKNCESARNRLKQLNAHAKIFYKDDSGKENYMDEKQRSEEKQKAQSRVDKWCQ